jgi:hypothetical protein
MRLYSFAALVGTLVCSQTSLGETRYSTILVGMTENRSATTYSRNGTSTQQLTNRHFVGLTFKVTSQSVTINPAERRNFVSHHYVGVGDGGEIMAGGNAPSYGSIPAPSTGTISHVRVEGDAANQLYSLGYSTTQAPLSGSSIDIYSYTIETWEDWSSQSQTWVPGGSSSYYKYTVQFAKLGTADASIDTRKAFGQPNKEGEIIPDANSPLRHILFGSSKFKGGLFAGNIDPASGDTSGTARIQLVVDSSSSYTNIIAAGLSLFSLGHAGSAPETVPLGLYVPLANDTYLTRAENLTDWAHRWTITPNVFSSTATDFSLYPFETKSFGTSTTAGEYYVYNLFRPGTTYTNGAFPARILQYICLAAEEETEINGWHYFGGKEYQNDGTSIPFPRSDSAARVWIGNLTSSSSW